MGSISPVAAQVSPRIATAKGNADGPGMSGEFPDGRKTLELVTPFVHLVGMEPVVTFVTGLGAAIAALVLLAVGIFSLLAIFWDDLLEEDRSSSLDSALTRSL